jgi:hypothetical protein
MKQITKVIFLIMILSLIKISYCYKDYDHDIDDDDDDDYDYDDDCDITTITKTKIKFRPTITTDIVIIITAPTTTITTTTTDTTSNTVTITTPTTIITTTTATTTTTTTPTIENCFEENGLGTIKHQDGNAMTYDDCINNFGNCPAGTIFYGLQYRVIQGSANYYTCFCYSNDNKPTVTSGECSKFENNADNKLYYYGEDKRYVYIFSNPPPPAITTPV